MRSILITGASSGIGRAVAIALASAESELVLVARRAEVLEQVAEQVRGLGGAALPVTGDLEQIDAIPDLASLWNDRPGYPVLINCAGVGVFNSFADLDWDDVQRQANLNYLAPARLIHACLPMMLARGGGQIINVLSMAAQTVMSGCAAYSSSKAALLMLGKTVSQEYRRQGVRVTSLMPGAVDTPIWEGSPMESRTSEMIPTQAVAELIRQIVASPDSFNLDEILMMPPTGVL